MVKSLLKARNSLKKAIESLYEGVCTVSEYQKVRDERTKLVKNEEVIVLEDQPCRLSYESKKVAAPTDSANEIEQNIKLFLAPDIPVKAGSKITVSQNGVTTIYKHSGVSAVYASHQEIVLELFKEWS